MAVSCRRCESQYIYIYIYARASFVWATCFSHAFVTRDICMFALFWFFFFVCFWCTGHIYTILYCFAIHIWFVCVYNLCVNGTYVWYMCYSYISVVTCLDHTCVIMRHLCMCNLMHMLFIFDLYVCIIFVPFMCKIYTYTSNNRNSAYIIWHVCAMHMSDHTCTILFCGSLLMSIGLFWHVYIWHICAMHMSDHMCAILFWGSLLMSIGLFWQVYIWHICVIHMSEDMSAILGIFVQNHIMYVPFICRIYTYTSDVRHTYICIWYMCYSYAGHTCTN